MRSQPNTPAKCERCGKHFKTWPYKLRAGEGRFCSKSCSNFVPVVETIEARFRRNVEPGAARACWDWRGPIGKNGYGMFRTGRRSGRSIYAHRVAFALSQGIEYRAVRGSVCHRCDNRRCVNPAHLFLGSQAHNMRDMAVKLRAGRRKLAPDQVLTARRMAADGAPLRKIMTTLQISRSQASRIVARKSWAWLA